MRHCFCEDLKELKEIDKQFEFKEFKRRYTVALVAYDYKGHRSHKNDNFVMCHIK